MNQSAETIARKIAGAIVTDSAGRRLELRELDVLEESRLIRAVGADAQNIVYMNGYPLNATLAQLQAANFATSALALGNNDQTGTYTVAGGLATQVTAAMATNLGSPQLIDLGSGKKAIEFIVDLPAYASGALSIYAGLEVMTLDNSNGVSISAYKDTDGSLRLIAGIKRGGSSVLAYGAGGYSFGQHTVLLEFDSASATVSIKVDGSALTLGSNAYNAMAGYVIGASVVESAGCSSADAGLQISVTLNSNAAGMRTPLDAGYTDICGNAA